MLADTAPLIGSSALHRLQAAKVPVLPAGVPELIAVLGDSGVPFEKLAEVLERFPTIVGRLIALANSPWSSPSSPIVSLQEAASRLGFGVVRSVAIALVVAAPFQANRCPEFDSKRFWCASLLTADGAAEFCSKSESHNLQSPDIARTSGLLRNLGLLWMVDVLPEPTNRALQLNATEPGLSVDATLRQLCGFGHVQAAGILASAWQLPPVLVGAMSGKPANDSGYDDRAIILGVSLAASIASMLLLDPEAAFDWDFPDSDVFENETCEHVRDFMAGRLSDTKNLAESLFS